MQATDLGPVEGRPEARRVALENIPLYEAKPTLGDVIVVEPDELLDGCLAWDRRQTPFNLIHTRIEQEGGRYTMILRWRIEGDVASVWVAMGRALAAQNILMEGVHGPSATSPGCSYLAVPDSISPASVLRRIRALKLPIKVTKEHP